MLKHKRENSVLVDEMIKRNYRMRPTFFASVLGIVLLLCPNVSLIASALPHETPAETRAKLGVEALRRGEELRRKWNLDSAEAAFREAASLEPASLEAALGLARIARARLA